MAPNALMCNHLTPLGLKGLRQQVAGFCMHYKGGLNQYDAERFVRLTFATVRKSGGLKRLKVSYML